MKKTVLAALISATCFPALADTPAVVIYGKLNASIQAADDKDTDGSETQVKNNYSRFGLKGGVELTETLQAVYKMEFGVNIADDDKTKDNITGRSQYVGLKGSFGEILVGRNDTALKTSQGGADQFSDIEGDIKFLFQGENREGDALHYTSPTFNQFKFAATVITEDNSSQKDLSGDRNTGISAALHYGDSKLKKSDLFASVGYDSEVNGGWDVLRATAQYKWNQLVIGGMVQNQERDTAYGGNGEDQTGYMMSLAYTLDAVTLKAQYQTMEDIALDDDSGKSTFAKGNDSTVINLGADYKLGKPTKLYAYFTQRDWDDVQFTNDGGDLEDKESYLGVGLIHLF